MHASTDLLNEVFAKPKSPADVTGFRLFFFFKQALFY